MKIKRSGVNFSRYTQLNTRDTINALVEDKMLHISACMNVISRKFVNEHKLYFKKGITGEDIDWAFRVFSKMPTISVLPNFFYVYRVGREGSVTSTIGLKNILDYCDILERATTIIESGNDQIKDAMMSYCMYHLLICAALNESNKSSFKQKRYIRERLKLLCKDRIHKYTLDSRVKLASSFYKFFGFTAMAKILSLYLNRRNRNHSYPTEKYAEK